jgi:hypothetical protein
MARLLCLGEQALSRLSITPRYSSPVSVTDPAASELAKAPEDCAKGEDILLDSPGRSPKDVSCAQDGTNLTRFPVEMPGDTVEVALVLQPNL